MRTLRPPQMLALWILFCAYLNITGWALSAIHSLNELGYLLALLIGAGLFICAFKLGQWPTHPLNCAGMRWRFRHALPASFLFIATLVFIGGALYAPNNYDALTYRIPRVLHWLERGGWHWIDTPNMRMNTRAPGFEWLMAPLLALTRTTRLLFILNFLSFLFMPGLLFQVFRLLGIRRRVAWNWMWVIPTGYLYVLQAGSVGNDCIATVFFLASLNFALRGKTSQRFGDIAMSFICIALTTSVKQSNLPLGLPWVVAIWPALALIWKNKLRTIVVLAVAAMTSYMPLALLNHSHGVNWLGVEPMNGISLPISTNMAGNFIQLAAQNLSPPVFPVAKKIESFLKSKIPARLLGSLTEGFEGKYSLSLGELQIEEFASLGIGVSLLALATLGSATKRRTFWKLHFSRLSVNNRLVALTGFIALMSVMGKSQMATLGRVSAAYYPLLFVPILWLPSTEQFVKRKSWTTAAIFSAFLSVLVVVMTPARPLWPAQTFLNWFAKNHQENEAVQRAQSVYKCYAQRADCMAPLRQILPPGTHTVGFIGTGDDPEASLWFPLGTLVIWDISTKTTTKSRDYDYVIANPNSFAYTLNTTLADWLKAENATIIGSADLSLKVQTGIETWYLIRLPAKK